MGEAAGNRRLILGLLSAWDLAVRVGVELRAGDTEGVQQECEGVARGGVAQVGRGFELGSSVGDDGGQS